MLFDYERENFSLKAKVYLTTDFFLVSEGEFHVESWLGVEDVQIKIDYDSETYKVPLPKKYYSKNIYNLTVGEEHHEGVLEKERLFNLKETNPKDNSRFTLSAFGLPEPDFGGHRTNRFHYVFIGIGLLMFGTGAWRMVQKRRENA